MMCDVREPMTRLTLEPRESPAIARAGIVAALIVGICLRTPLLMAAPVVERPITTGDSDEAVAGAIGAPAKIHEAVFLGERFPSATTCAPCHPKHFQEWSISQHAYAQMSPIFNAMNGKILKLTNGTNGDFCIRCHTPVGMNLGEREFMSNIDRHPTSREGVTCIVCHRVNRSYGKLSGRLAIVEGDLTRPVYGPRGDNAELQRVVEEGGVITDPDRAGRKIHRQIDRFFQLTTSGFCGTCHDVTLVNGFRLEEAFSEFKSAPAAGQGISCQDCHMGKKPGRILTDRDDPEFERKNYDVGPAAKVGSLATAPRKLTNHMFVGPDYSVLAPSLFPFNVRAIKEESEKDDPTARGFATIREWLQFDHKAGWGTDEFEDAAPEDYEYPQRWASVDDRFDAREIIEENEALLTKMTKLRLELLRAGYLLGDVVVERADEKRIRFRIEVKSGTNGHNVPTGFDAERLVWLFVQVRDADGTLIAQSGDLDPNGDLRDLHSAYVHNHELPLDKQLFSLQSRFLTRNVRGGEREQVLAVNYSPSPLPFLRPERRSSVLLGRPGGARKHKKGIEPGGHRWATYVVKKKQLTGRGPYVATIQLKAAMVPVNLVNEIRDVGFDYDMSAREVADNLVAGHQIIWEREVPLVAKSGD